MEFNVNEIEKTFTKYQKGKVYDGVVVSKKQHGVVFNIGGKNDAFIKNEDLNDFENLKIGERFKVLIKKQKNEEGFIEASQKEAETFIKDRQNAERLKLGEVFSFVATDFRNGLISKMGPFEVFVPVKEISKGYVHDFKSLIGKQFNAVVTEINQDNSRILASIKILQEETQKRNDELFWSSVFINKIVNGKVKKILDYGIFVDVNGVDCFCHISNLSYDKISKPNEVVKEGDEKLFKVVELDREKKRVALGLKQLEKNPKEKAIEEISIGEKYSGKVIKILQFGALIELDNGVVGLLHISNATEKREVNIYEIVKLDDVVDVLIIDINNEKSRVSFKLF